MFISNLPRSSATVRARLGDAAEWGLPEHLLASAVDALNAANWQRAGDKHHPRPKPVKRPNSTDERFGRGAIPISEFRDWWDSN